MSTSKKIREKSKMTELLRLLKMMKKGFWIYLIAIIAMSFSMAGFQTVIAFLLKNIIQMAQTHKYDGIVRMVLQNIALGLLTLVIYAISFACYTIQAKRGCANLQETMLTKSLRLPYDYYENTHSGDFMSKLMYDCSRTEDVYGSRFRRILMPCLMVVWYLVPMFLLSWQVTACLMGVCIITFFVNALYVKPMKKISGQLSNTHTSLTERLTNLLSGMELVKIFALDRILVNDYVADNKEFCKGQKKQNRLSASLEGLNECFDLLSSLVFIALSIYFVSIKITTVDRLAAIYIMYGSMSWNFLQIGIYIPSMASCLTNASRVFEFIDAKEEPIQKGKVSNKDVTEIVDITKIESDACTNVETTANNYITMRDVDFSYDLKTPILKDFNLAIERGKTVALKGESGKGKSTIAKILLGLYPIQKGTIAIGGKTYEKLGLDQIRSMIGYVPQEPYLYQVSIAENIRYGRPEASKEEIIAAAKAANAHEFIEKLESGYDTNAGERGNHLSGGERQRIAIARAVLKNAPILILDEATSALDHESERLVNEALERLMEGRTTIMIAHRPSTLERADVVVEL